MEVQGYKRKTKAQLLKAIDECVSISQLCALVQHEGIVIMMQCQQGASNLPKKVLSPKDLIPDKSPLDRLKQRVKEAVNNRR